MNLQKLVAHHRLFFVFLGLFFVVGAIDILNLDRLCYKAVCDAASPLSGSPCPPYYDLPIWNVYLSLAMLAALYHVHDELKRHNTSHKH